MEMKELFQEIKDIEMPDEMQRRIMRNCYDVMEESQMNKSSAKKKIKKPVAIAVALAVCGCLTGITALAATGHLQGFFRDITRSDGAVTGTTYEQATNEINMSVTESSGEITVTVEFVEPNKAPYTYFENFGINEYEIADAEGNILVIGGETEMTALSDGKAEIAVPADGLANGAYKLNVSKFVGGKKADQPLELSGQWECEFTIE